MSKSSTEVTLKHRDFDGHAIVANGTSGLRWAGDGESLSVSFNWSDDRAVLKCKSSPKEVKCMAFFPKDRLGACSSSSACARRAGPAMPLEDEGPVQRKRPGAVLGDLVSQDVREKAARREEIEGPRVDDELAVESDERNDDVSVGGDEQSKDEEQEESAEEEEPQPSKDVANEDLFEGVEAEPDQEEKEEELDEDAALKATLEPATPMEGDGAVLEVSRHFSVAVVST